MKTGFQTFISRLHSFASDPLLENSLLDLAPSLSTKAIFRFVTTVGCGIGMCAALLTALQSTALDAVAVTEECILTYTATSILAMLALALGSVIGFMITKILGGKRTLREYISITILELPVTLTLSIISNAVKAVALTYDAPHVLVALPLLTMTSAYRNLILTGVQRRVASVFTISVILIVMLGYGIAAHHIISNH